MAITCLAKTCGVIRPPRCLTMGRWAGTLLLAVTALAEDTTPDAARQTAAAEQPPVVNVFEGRVLSHDSREPVPGTIVAIADADEGYIGYDSPGAIEVSVNERGKTGPANTDNAKRAVKVTTDDQGRFRIDHLRAGKYNLLTVHPQRGAVVIAGLDLPAGGTTKDVVLEAPAFLDLSFRGILPREPQQTSVRFGALWPWLRTAERKSMNFAALAINPFIPISEDADVRIGPLPVEGDWVVTVFPLAGKALPELITLQKRVRVEFGKTAAVEVNLNEGTRLQGRLIGPDDVPLANALISLALLGEGPGPRRFGARTDAKGEYVVRGLPDGKYKLESKRWGKKTRPG